MKRGTFNNLEHENTFCPIRLKEMLNALKQKNVVISRQLSYLINTPAEAAIVKNIFTLKSKNSSKFKFELKTY